MKKAPVNRLIPFSNVDGPGNRFAIFLQKCPFRCWYCHNPETINECIHCGACVKTCPAGALSMVDEKVVWDQMKCVQCDTCIHTCPNLSTPKIQWMSVEDVVAEIQKVRMFIRGITVSGGECMEHPAFLTELFREVQKMGLTCFIDSNGAYDFEQYPELLKVTDAVMLDVKAMDSAFHQQLTGQDNQMVLKNLQYLLKIGKLYEVRTVLLNGYEKENEQTVKAVSEIILDRCRYKLIKYRPYGVRTSEIEKLGAFTLSDETLMKNAEIASKYGVKDVVVV